MNLREALSRLRGLVGNNRSDSELDEEIRAHLEMTTEDNIRRGMNPDEARQAARRSFGPVEPMREAYRDRSGIPSLEALRQDLRSSVRSWRSLRCCSWREVCYSRAS